jgi:uncharacterized protein (DUF885 family)
MKTQTYSTRYLSVMLLLWFVSLLGCSDKTETTANPAPQNLTQWLDAQYEEQLLQSPLGLTYLGRSERKDELDEFTFESFKRKLAWQAASVAEMEALFDRAALSEAEKLSYDLWKYSFEKTAASEQYFFNGLIFDQMNGIHSYVPTFLINFHTVESAEDFEALIARVNLVESRMADAIEVARKSSANGVIAPYFAMDGVIEQSEKIISGQPFDQEADFDNALWADMKRDLAGLVEAGVIDNAAATSLEARAQDALLNSFGPAYRNIITWAKEERQSSPEVATGIGSQPGGDAYYEHLLASQTTTDLTADEIHNIGLKEVSRLRLEMLSIMEEVEFKGDLQAFFEEVRTAEWNYYPDTDEGRQAYIDDATLAIDELKALLPTYFGLLPKADLVVKRVEAFRERDGAAQHYFPGTPDGSRPGTYYAHLSDMTAMPKNQLEVIAYHEGLPGHHMQISIAQELEGVPQFQTQLGFTAYVEGWALYSEQLASEMPGTYKDAYQQFGRLSSEIWRAIRLVVDTGLHAKGWTEQQAIDYFMANSPEPYESIRSEVRRYIVYPGQATTYKIGMIKILELRARAIEELGDQFDIRGFHDTVLGAGALPLDFLEKRVVQWIEATKAK